MAHTSKELLKKNIVEAQEAIEIDALYAHYKNPGHFYKVIAVGLQEATEKPCVIYQDVQNPTLIWVRDLDSWTTFIEETKSPRFIKID